MWAYFCILPLQLRSRAAPMTGSARIAEAVMIPLRRSEVKGDVQKGSLVRGLSQSDWGNRKSASRHLIFPVSGSFHHCVVPLPQEGGLGLFPYYFLLLFPGARCQKTALDNLSVSWYTTVTILVRRAQICFITRRRKRRKRNTAYITIGGS